MDKILTILISMLNGIKEKINKKTADTTIPKPEQREFQYDGMNIHTSQVPIPDGFSFNLSFKFDVVATDDKNVVYYIDAMYITGQNERSAKYLSVAPRSVVAQMVSLFCKVYYDSPYQMSEMDDVDEFGNPIEQKKEYMN